MALNPGIVVVAPSGTVTAPPGTLAASLFTTMKSDAESTTTPPSPILEIPDNVIALSVLAAQANAIANEVCTHFIANAQVVNLGTTLSVDPGINVVVNPITFNGVTVAPPGTGTGSTAIPGQII